MGRDRKTLAFGMLLLLLGALGLLRAIGFSGRFFSHLFLSGMFMAGAALLAFAASSNLARRAYWLLPAGILAAGSLINLGQSLRLMPDPLVNLILAAGFAVPFAVIYQLDHRRTWALWFAWCAALIGVAAALENLGPWGQAIAGTAVLWGSAIPFVLMFLRGGSERPLIAAGSLITVGFLPLVDRLDIDDRFSPAILLLGLGLTFATVYVLGRPGRVAWARNVAFACGGLGIFIALSGPVIGYVVPIALIIAGAWLIFGTGAGSSANPQADIPASPAPPATT